MQSPWLFNANLLLNGFAFAGVLIVVWIGWLRTHRIAWLILAAWSLSVMVGIGLQSSYFSVALALLGGSLNTQGQYELLWSIQLIRSLVSSALLLAGLGLLVFANPKRASAAREF